MAGVLADRITIPVDRMRVLGKYAIILALDGTGFYADETGRRCDLRAGDVIHVRPHLGHAYGTSGDKPWGQAYVVFDGPQFELLDNTAVLNSKAPVWHLEPIDFWRQRLEDLFIPGTTQTEFKALHTVSGFASLLVEMCAVDAEARQNPDEAWISTSQHLLGEPQNGTWARPREVARCVGLSYENFRKRFSEKTGQPPTRYQMQRRIDLACAAIYRGASNFKELAEELGFCDVYHFSKVFRQHVGEPPSSYRRRVRGG